MALFQSFDISASGMTAQRFRMDTISENVANVNTTSTENGTPYRRKIVTFSEKGVTPFSKVLSDSREGYVGNGVKVSSVTEDYSTDFTMEYDPSNPDADENGYVSYPNVNIVTEMTNLIDASRAYEANVTAFDASKQIAQPDILFEGCAAGGNRFDLGILSYFPQIWASDDTDALYRVNGMTGYSYGYPMSVVSAHVSACPNHQTLRTTPLATRFNVAAFGVCGYECNLCDMSKNDLLEIKEQISIYKNWREVLMYGTFYRGRCGNVHEWTCVSKDRKRAVGMIMQELVQPNIQFEQFFPKGLEKQAKYKFFNRDLRYNIKGFGDLVNTASPIHIKQDSVLHNVISKFVTMPGECEEYTSPGSVLMAGVKLKQGFAATGYNDNTRYYQDFGSRIYFMEMI